MQKRTLTRKAIKYCRTYGIQAALRRSLAEIHSRIRRARGRVRPRPNVFDQPAFLAMLSEDVRLVIFDIFDTLVSRPLLDPESTKHLVAGRLGRPDYVARRRQAEESLRTSSPRDVGLAAICAEYVRLFGDEDGDAALLQATEEVVEIGVAVPRHEGIKALAAAGRAGKRVVLASDMFLSAGCIAALLERCGIAGYDALYVSSEIGVRKSTGELYRHIARLERVPFEQMLMVGDHPVSDQQVPTALGIITFPVESPIAVAMRSPRFGPWLRKALSTSNVATELWLGLIAQRFFNAASGALPLDDASLTQDGRRGIGYGIVGPLLVGFSEWLLERAQTDGIRRLYFLAREGQLMRDVFETLHGGRSGVETSYLVLSRRAVTVAMVHSRDDILDIARAPYHRNALSEFVYRRYGLELSSAQLTKIDREGVWPTDKEVEVQNERIDHLGRVLEALEPQILQQAAEERPPLLAYLHGLGMNEEAPAAVVDVGYAGTIQGRLCELLGRPFHGYYMVTRGAARDVRARHAVRVQGCYGQDLDTPEGSPLLRYNLPLEMLMGSDDAQVRRYRLGGDGVPLAEFQPLSDDEVASAAMRSELREGALAFARDYRALGETGLCRMHIDRELAADLFRDFWEGASETERRQIMLIASDDHYCGMGIVHFATFLQH